MLCITDIAVQVGQSFASNIEQVRGLRFLGLAIVVTFVVMLVSFWQRHAIPADVDTWPASHNEPLQTTTTKPAFDVSYAGEEYRVEPVYTYDITGMVVSYRHHDGNSRMHKRSGDVLNMLDVCIVWGDNLQHPDLRKLKFWNGIFTCNVQTRDREAWAAFRMQQLSNNHLISANDEVRDRVRGLAIGDHINVRGYLASYGNQRGGHRGTSTTRTDTGDGACETIYVEEFTVVRAGFNAWRYSLYASTAVFVLLLLLWFRKPYKPYS